MNPLLRRPRCNDAAVDLLSYIVSASKKPLTRNWVENRSIANFGKMGNRGFSSSRRTKHGGNSKKPKVKLSTPGNGSPVTWCTSTAPSGSATTLEMGRYNLKRLDYTTMKPPIWTAPPHPPTKTTAERVVFPLSIAIAAGFCLWIYMSPEEEDMTEYWKRVETGQIIIFDDEYDDDDDDEA